MGIKNDWWEPRLTERKRLKESIAMEGKEWEPNKQSKFNLSTWIYLGDNKEIIKKQNWFS